VIAKRYRGETDDLTVESLGIPGEKERHEIRKSLVRDKLEQLLLPAMRAHDIDMWLIIAREFNPDPLLPDVGEHLPGVRNVYAFFDHGGDQAEKIFVGSHPFRESIIPDTYDNVTYYGYSQEGLRPHLKELVESRDPQRIGVNMSPTLPMADGLTVMMKQYLEDAIGEKYTQRLVSAELVARDFRANRIPEELPVFCKLCAWTVAWEEMAFSPKVLRPGETTADDIQWWMRDKARALGMELEFLPGVRVTHRGDELPTGSEHHVIQAGDVASVDAGLAFIDYRSDVKRTVYILRPGESEPSPSIRNAFAKGLEMAEVLTANMKPGAIAHEVWDQTMAWARGQGYEIDYPLMPGPTGSLAAPRVGIYCHSVGNATHDIGARIAVDWPHAYGDRVRYPLGLNQWYSIELHVTTPIPEWDNKGLCVRIEDTAVLTEDGVEYVVPPQRELLLI
jgi:Xaa-Pro aminopeptidase